MDKILFGVSVVLAKLPKRGTQQRAGFRDGKGLIYMPPASAKKASAWKKAMESKGFSFAAAA